jgi:hypothetical protein
MMRTTTLRTKLVAGTALAASTLLAGSAYAAVDAAPARTAAASAPQAADAARPANQVKLTLTPSSPQLAACFPHAKAKVKVDLTTDEIGKDTFSIKAKGLQPDTTFTLFLIEKAGLPFGAVEYFGDFTTDGYGKATNDFELIVEEAFAFNNETQARTDLNSVGFWFGDSTADDDCLGAASPVTGFDGDAEAGVQMMNSGTQFLP